MVYVSVEQFVNNPQELLDRIAAGKPFFIARDGKPIAEVIPVVDSTKKARRAGVCKGQFIVPDDFDAPLPDEILREFYGDVFPGP